MKTLFGLTAFLCLFIGCKHHTFSPINTVESYQAQELYARLCSGFTSSGDRQLIDSLPQTVNWTEAYRKNISGQECLIVDLKPDRTRQVNTTDQKLSPGVEQYGVFRRNKNGELFFELVMFWLNGWEKSPLSFVVFNQHGELVRSYISDGKGVRQTDLKVSHDPKTKYSRGVAACVETDWYSCVYYQGQNMGCNYNYTTYQCLESPDSDPGGSTPPPPANDPGGGSGLNYAEVADLPYTTFVTAPPEGRVITDIVAYFDCFTIAANAAYEVTLYVKQPLPHSRTLVSDGHGNKLPSSLDLNSITVGHAFLGFQQSTGQQTFNRVIGFYPSTAVSPFWPYVPGLPADNSNTDYDVSVTFSLSAEQFDAVKRAFLTTASGYYNLSYNNCATACINALNTVGLNVPRTIGTWPLGSGANPADLGEDLRGFSSSSVKQKNLKGGSSPANTPPCH